MPEAPATILGGLPVIADVSFGYDSYNMEYWSEVNTLYWRRRNGTKGKEVSKKIYDRAMQYDYGLSNVIEQVNDYLSYENEKEEKVKCPLFSSTT